MERARKKCMSATTPPGAEGKIIERIAGTISTVKTSTKRLRKDGRKRDLRSQPGFKLL